MIVRLGEDSEWGLSSTSSWKILIVGDSELAQLLSKYYDYFNRKNERPQDVVMQNCVKNFC